MSEERANGLMDDVLDSPDTDMTEEMVEEAGGRDEVIAQVLAT